MSEVALDEFRERDRRALTREDSLRPIKKDHLQVSGQGQIRRGRVRVAGSFKDFKHQYGKQNRLKTGFFSAALCDFLE
jgi:hypothetical protein